MVTVYVLESLRHKKRCTGVTERDVTVRLNEHNAGVTPWTRENGPFKLVHTEVYDSLDFARRRERFLKTGKGRRVLQNLVPSTVPKT